MESLHGGRPGFVSQEDAGRPSTQDGGVLDIQRKIEALQAAEIKQLSNGEAVAGESEPPYEVIPDQERAEIEAIGRAAATVETRERNWRELQGTSLRAELARAEQAYLMGKAIPEYLLQNPESKPWVEEAGFVVLDLTPFTGLAEAEMREEGKGQGGKGAQRVNNLIRSVFGLIDIKARPAGGEVVGFAGDEVNYVFRGSGYKERMLHFASQVREAMQERKDVQISGGVAAGPVLFGYLEISDKRNLPIVLGETVVRAKKLQGNATAGDIYVADNLLPLLPEEAKIARGSGVALEYYQNYEVVGEYYDEQRKHEAEETSRGRTSFAEIERRAKFLHPSLNFDLRSEGLKRHLFDAERKSASLVFARLHNFREMQAQILEEVAAGEISTTLQKLEQFLGQVNQLAHKHHMLLEKFVPDDKPKIVLFGQRTPPAARAMKTSFGILDIADRMGLDISIGISSGKVYRGMTGVVAEVHGSLPPEETKEELGFIGDAANVAAHFASETPVGRIRTDRYTILDAEDTLRIEAEEVPGGQVLKSRRGHGHPYEIKRVESFGETLEHTSGARLVGRNAQVELINRTIDEAIREKCQRVVVVSAEAGEGKSLLTDTIITERYLERHPRRDNVEAFKGKSYSDSENTAYQLWRGVARKLFNVEDKDTPAEVLVRIESELTKLDPNYTQYAQLMAESFRLAKVEVEDSQRFPGFVGKAAEIFSRMLDERSKDKPVLVVFEDIHWADHPSLELLKYVLVQTKDSRVVYDLVMRPHAEKLKFLRIDPERRVDIELGPLEKKDWANFILAHFYIKGMRELAEHELAGDTSWRSDFQSETYKRIRANERLRDMTFKLSDGNPFQGRASLKGLTYYHEVYPDRVNPKTKEPYRFLVPYGSNEYRIRDYIDEATVKELSEGTGEGLRDAFRSLPKRAQQVFKFAAYLGRDFSLADVAELGEMSYEQLGEYMELGRRRNLIEDRDELTREELSFTHERIWEAVHNITADILVSVAGREFVISDEEISRRAGELIERKYGADRLEDLARLFGGSDNFLKAIHYKILLGDRNFAREDVVHYGIAINTYSDAIKIFKENFIEQDSSADSTTSIARQEQKNRRRRENWAGLSETETQHVVSDFIEAHEKLARVYLQSGYTHYGDALEIVGRGVEALNRFETQIKEPIRQINLRLMLAAIDTTAHRFSGNIKGALELAEKYADGIVKQADTMLVGRSEQGHSEIKTLTSNLASFYANYGTCESKSNNWDGALALYDKALVYAELAGDTKKWYLTTNAKVWTLGRQGKVDEAIRLGKELLEVSVKNDYKSGIPFLKSNLGEFHRRQGDWQQAKNYLSEALEMARDWSPAQEIGIYTNLVSVLEAEGNFSEALRVMDLTIDALGQNNGDRRTTGDMERHNRYVAERAFILAKLGQFEAAMAVAQNVPTTQLTNQATKGFVALAEALCDAGLGVEPERTRAKFVDSVATLKQGGGSPEALIESALWERSIGGERECQRLLTEALTASERQGEYGYSKKIRELMLSPDE